MLRDPGLREPGLREIPLLETYYGDTDCINTSLIEKTNCHLKPNADEIVFHSRFAIKMSSNKEKTCFFNLKEIPSQQANR